jgi:hypothetical protein
VDKDAELTGASYRVHFSLHKYVNEQCYLKAKIKMGKYSQGEISHKPTITLKKKTKKKNKPTFFARLCSLLVKKFVRLYS